MYNHKQVNKIIDRNICILSRYSHYHSDEKLKKLQLNKTQAEIIMFIYDHDDLSLADINRYFMFNKATITKNIKYLIELELVSWHSSKKDKRKKLMLLTEKGKVIIPEIITVLEKWDKNLTLELTNKEIESLSEILHTITRRITENEEY